LWLGTSRPLYLRPLNLRAFRWALHIRAFGASLSLRRSLTRFHPWGNLPHRFLLALNALAVLTRRVSPRLRLLALLEALPNRGFALSLLIKLASLMLDLALQLSLAHLPVAILSHSVGQSAPIEYRSLRGRRSFAARPLDAGRTIRSIADHGRPSIRVALALAANLRSSDALPR